MDTLEDMTSVAYYYYYFTSNVYQRNLLIKAQRTHLSIVDRSSGIPKAWVLALRSNNCKLLGLNPATSGTKDAGKA